MNVSGATDFNTQVVSVNRNEATNSQLQDKAIEAQSVDILPTEHPVQKILQLNKDIVNARVSEYQTLSSGNQVTADEAVGSLIDVRI